MGWPPSLKPDKTASQDLSLGALSYTTDFGRRFKLNMVALKATTGITETVTITLSSGQGTTYNVVLASYNLEGESSYVWRPEGDLILYAGDEIKVECTNANLTGTIKALVKASEQTV